MPNYFLALTAALAFLTSPLTAAVALAFSVFFAAGFLAAAFFAGAFFAAGFFAATVFAAGFLATAFFAAGFFAAAFFVTAMWDLPRARVAHSKGNCAVFVPQYAGGGESQVRQRASGRRSSSTSAQAAPADCA